MIEKNNKRDSSEEKYKNRAYFTFQLIIDCDVHSILCYFDKDPEHNLKALFSSFKLPPVELKIEKRSNKSVGLFYGVLYPRSILLKKYVKLNIIPLTDRQTQIEIVFSDYDNLNNRKKLNAKVLDNMIKILRIVKDIFLIIDRLF